VSAHPVAIVGSGFAGSMLARLLAARGRRAVLIERGTHPRFALGESSTPLAAICLERLAREHGLADLAALGAYGRWSRELPALRRGLKRGFTFYAHVPGRPYANNEENSNRLLVAASPDDEIADLHWLRSDVDAFLVERAAAEGVEYVDRCELSRLTRTGAGWRLEGTRAGQALAIDASFVVDGSGSGEFVARALGEPPADPAARQATRAPDTALVFGHFEGCTAFVDAAAGAAFPPSPYPEERAAIHHLLEEGWMYVLPFDHGVVSAGIVLDRAHPSARLPLEAPPEVAWRRVLERYPSLRAQFADARPVRPLSRIERLPRRARAAVGPGWALLPHTFAFASPMFSTGIAWSLVAVERLAQMLGGETGASPNPVELASYGCLLETEADAITALVGPAYALREHFDAFAAWTHLYFAAASYSEARQRLCDPPVPGGWTAQGFLGACDPVLHAATARATRALREGTPDPEGTVRALIARRNVAGLADPARRHAYPVDLEVLVERAPLLGLDEASIRARLPRLRGHFVPIDARPRVDSGLAAGTPGAAPR